MRKQYKNKFLEAIQSSGLPAMEERQQTKLAVSNFRLLVDASRRSAAVPAAPNASVDAGAASGAIRIRKPRTPASLGARERNLFCDFPAGGFPSKICVGVFQRRAPQHPSQSSAAEARVNPFRTKTVSLSFLRTNRKTTRLWRGKVSPAKPPIAQLVAEALLHFEAKHYQLWAWCVMPNHVHAEVELRPGYSLSKVLHSWKSYSAKTANEILSREGPFWQKEYYDHLVRDERQLLAYIRYVLDNPRKAGLRDWPWVWARTAAAPAAS